MEIFMNILIVEIEHLGYGDPHVSFLQNFLIKEEYSVDKCYLDEFLTYIDKTKFNYHYTVFMTTEHEGAFNRISKIIETVRECNPSASFIIAGPMVSFYRNHVRNLTDTDFVIKGCLIPKIKEFLENGISSRSNPVDIGNDFDANMLEIDADTYPYNDNGIYSMLQSIGCNYGKCTFCPLKHMYGSIKVRPIKNIIRDMKKIDTERNAKVFLFRDQNFLINNNRFRDLCNEMNNENLQQKLQFCARADSVIKCLPAISEIPQRISSISIGIESFLQTQLNRYNKGITPEQAFLALDSLVKLGVKTKYFLILADNQTDFNELLQISGIFRRKPEYILMLASSRLREYFEYDNEQADYPDYVKIYHKALEGVVKFNNSSSEGLNTYKLFLHFKAIPDTKRSYINRWLDWLDDLVKKVNDQQICYTDALAAVEDNTGKICSVLGGLYS